MKTFDAVPVEPETRIICKHEVVMQGGLPALMERWVWDGIVAESVIFHADDVADMDDDELFNFVKASCIVGDDERHTVKRSLSGYTFVNYNFKLVEDLMFD